MPEEDDYGDDPSTAHEIDMGESVEGLIGQLDDRDYFKFTANEGQVYRIDASPHPQGNRPDDRTSYCMAPTDRCRKPDHSAV